MDPQMMVELGALALVGGAALIAGIAEDLESDVGSQSNPNSQVQLAPQMGYLHRLYNKAISGEPASYPFYAVMGAATALSVLSVTKNYSLIGVFFALIAGAFVTSLIHGVYATTSYMGRLASQSRFGQPIYLDILRTHTPVLMAHGFIANFSVLLLTWVLIEQKLSPFPFVVLAFIWGVALGGVGSAVGDVHLGTDRYYQDRPYGSGVNAAHSGSVVRKAESGLRNSIDCAWFCSKFGGPLTGLGFGLVVYLHFWKEVVVKDWWSPVAGVIIVVIFIIMNTYLERYSRNRYGTYTEEAEGYGMFDLIFWLYVTLGGILVGVGVHFIPVGGAPAAMSQATGVGTGTTMLAAASGLTGLIGAGSAYAVMPGNFAFTIIMGGVSAALMISILAFIANVMYVYGAGVPLASAKVKYDPITRWRQDLYVSRGTEGHGSPMVSFISGILGGLIAGFGGALVYFGLAEAYKKIALLNNSGTFPLYTANYISLAAAFAIGIFFLNAVMASYNIGGTIEGFHDPKFKRVPKSIVASLVVSLVGGLFALLITTMLGG